MTTELPAAEDQPRLDRLSAGLILACAVIAVLPLLARGNSCGHDFDFHLQSWMEVAHQWREGVWYPRWFDAANYGAGEPRLLFYPPLSWIAGGGLGTLLPWNVAPFAYVFLAFAGCGFSAFLLAREWLPAAPARLAACMYLANPYLLFVAYERGAFGELLAAVWIPLVMLFTLRRRAALLPLSLAIAAVWLTNAPAAVMACYTAALLAVLTAVQLRQWWPVVRVAFGSVLGIALAGFYVVPAAFERRWVEIDRAIGSGMRVEDSFLFGHTGEAFHDQVLRTASWIAVALLALAALAAWRALASKDAVDLSRSLAVLLVVIAFLLFPFSEPLWRYAPELKFLQFPWRWLLVAGASGAMLVGIAVSQSLSRLKQNWLRASIPLALAALLAGCATKVYWQPCDDEDAVVAQVATFRAGAGFEGTDEYTPRGADNTAIQRGLPPVRFLARAGDDAAESSVEPNPEWKGSDSPAQEAQVEIRDWNAAHKSFSVHASRDGFAVLRLLDYPAWRVRVNGVAIPARPHRSDGLMTIPVNTGISMVEVRYESTADIDWGWGASLAALLVLIALLVMEKSWQKLRIS